MTLREVTRAVISLVENVRGCPVVVSEDASLNTPDDFILGMVEFVQDGSHKVHYLRQPFQR